MAPRRTSAVLSFISDDGENYRLSTAGTKASPGRRLVLYFLSWGDGTDPDSGNGPPPLEVPHSYRASGEYEQRLLVVDSRGGTAEAVMTGIVVRNALARPSFVTTSLADGVSGTLYDQSIQTAGSFIPHAYSVVAGSLPPGTSLSTTGTLICRISGTPSGGAATYNFTIRARDAIGQTIDQAFAINVTVDASPLTIDTVTLPRGDVSSPYSETLLASGGTAPYTWAIISGALPPGLSLAASTGVISGTTGSTQATYNFTVRVTDAVSATATKALSIQVSTEGPNDFFTTYNAHASKFLGVSFRSQAEINTYVQSLPSAEWKYYAVRADDPHLIAPDGAKLFFPPRGWWRDRVSYPNGAFTYFNGNTAYVDQWGASGNEGSNNWSNIKINVDIGPSTGFTDLTIIFDFWWDETFQTGRGSGGNPNAWKSFFFYGTGTEQFHHMHEVMNAANLLTGEMAGQHLGPGGMYTDAFNAAGVVTKDPFQPTGPGALGVNALHTKRNQWTRYWIHYRFAQTSFPDWNAEYGVTVAGTFDMLSIWIADESTEKRRYLYRVPIYRDPLKNLTQWRFAFDNSTNNLAGDALQVVDLGNIAATQRFTLTVPAFTNSRLAITTSQETTAEIILPGATDNISADIAAKLEALTGVDDAQVTKLGTGPQVYRVRFSGAPSGQTAIGAMTITVTGTGFTPGGVTQSQVGGNTSGSQGGPMTAYMRNFLLLKNFGTPNEADAAFFAKPIAGDDR